MARSVKITLNLPKIITQPQLEYIGEKIIKSDIKKRMADEASLSGDKYDALADSTVKSKERKNYLLPKKPLHATLKLAKSIIVEPYREGARIYLKDNRSDGISNDELADILQNQGVRTKRGKRYFEFFGISDMAEKKALKYMERYIRKTIKDGKRRTV